MAVDSQEMEIKPWQEILNQVKFIIVNFKLKMINAN